MTGTAKEHLRRMAQYCASHLVDRSARTVTADALSDFLESLYGHPQVAAVALMASQSSRTPTTLLHEVFVPLGLDKADDRTVEGVFKANGELFKRLHGTLSVSGGFVDTGLGDFNAIVESARDRWNQDPELRLLRFMRFQRAPSG